MNYLFFIYSCSKCMNIQKDNHIHIKNGLVVCNNCDEPLKDSTIQILKPGNINMASTIKTWKETFIHKYKDKGFNYFGWFDDKYEILFKKKLSDDHETIWFTAYVKLDEPLKDNYQFESYKNKYIIGTDSSDLTSWTEDYQKTILKVRIKSIIKEHYEK